MSNLLYITCNLSSPHHSRTLTLGREFLEEYLRWHPADEVQELDLFRDLVQRSDEDVLNVWRRIVRGEETVALTDEERRKAGRVWRLADQFARCDRYVFVTHSLNLWFPAEFKMYVDAICVPDRLYRFTETGREGALTGGKRRSLHLHAGPAQVGVEEDQSIPYLRSVLRFLGVTDQETVQICGDDPARGSAAEYQAARRGLAELARVF